MSSRRPSILLLVSDEHNSRVAGFAGDAVVRTSTLPLRGSRWAGRCPGQRLSRTRDSASTEEIPSQ